MNMITKTGYIPTRKYDEDNIIYMINVCAAKKELMNKCEKLFINSSVKQASSGMQLSEEQEDSLKDLYSRICG